MQRLIVRHLPEAERTTKPSQSAVKAGSTESFVVTEESEHFDKVLCLRGLRDLSQHY